MSDFGPANKTRRSMLAAALTAGAAAPASSNSSGATMTGSLLTQPKQLFQNASLNPLIGGSLYTYAAGTLKPKTTYQDAALSIANTNPTVANAHGEVLMFGLGPYRIILKDKSGNVIYDVDNIESAASLTGALSDSLAAATGASKVGFSPPGAGGISTTVAAQLSKDVFSSNYASLQQAHDAVVMAGGGTLWVDDTIVQNQPFHWDYNKVMISGRQGLGATIDFSSITAQGFAIIFANPAATQARKAMQNIRIIGPAARLGVSCFNFHSAVANAITNINFINVTIIDFAVQLFFGDHCSNCNWSMCQFTQSGANFQTTTVIKTDVSALNTGEALCFSQCQFNNIDIVLENNVGLAGGFQFTMCAMVYFRICLSLSQPARIDVVACNIESHTYTASWFSTNINGAMIRFKSTRFWFAGNITSAPFFSNINTVYGGIFIDDCDYHADTISIPYWFNQKSLGPVHVRGWRCQDGIGRIPMGANMGVQEEAWPTSHGNFAISLTKDAANNGNIGLSATYPDTKPNTTSLSTNTIGQVISVSKRYPISGGQNIEGSVRVRSAGFASDGSQFSINFALYDNGGLLIAVGGTISPTGDLTPYTPIRLNWSPLTPAGAAFYEIRIFANAQLKKGYRSIYLSDLVLNKY